MRLVAFIVMCSQFMLVQVKPLTEEEKKEKLQELRAKMSEKRSKKAEEEAKEHKANEALRRKAGKVPIMSLRDDGRLILAGYGKSQGGYESQAGYQRG